MFSENQILAKVPAQMPVPRVQQGDSPRRARVQLPPGQRRLQELPAVEELQCEVLQQTSDEDAPQDELRARHLVSQGLRAPEDHFGGPRKRGAAWEEEEEVSGGSPRSADKQQEQEEAKPVQAHKVPRSKSSTKPKSRRSESSQVRERRHLILTRTSP